MVRFAVDKVPREDHTSEDAVATRYDRTDGSFAAAIHSVAGVVAAA